MPRPFFTSTAARRSVSTSVGRAWKSWGLVPGAIRGVTAAQSPATARVNSVIGRKVVTTCNRPEVAGGETGVAPELEPGPELVTRGPEQAAVRSAASSSIPGNRHTRRAATGANQTRIILNLARLEAPYLGRTATP